MVACISDTFHMDFLIMKFFIKSCGSLCHGISIRIALLPRYRSYLLGGLLRALEEAAHSDGEARPWHLLFSIPRLVIWRMARMLALERRKGDSLCVMCGPYASDIETQIPTAFNIQGVGDLGRSTGLPSVRSHQQQRLSRVSESALSTTRPKHLVFCD